MLKQARGLKSNLLEISDKFCKKYQLKILECSVSLRKGNNFQKHNIEMIFPTKIGRTQINFSFYIFGVDSYLITNIEEFNFRKDNTLIGSLRIMSELDLIITILERWERN
jgi:hypothetical protein